MSLIVSLLSFTFLLVEDSFDLFLAVSFVLSGTKSLVVYGGMIPKIWRCSRKVQFLENTRFKTLEHL